MIQTLTLKEEGNVRFGGGHKGKIIGMVYGLKPLLVMIG